MRLLLPAAAVALLAAIQFIPVSMTNPAVTQDLSAPPPIGSLLRRGCYDCHSNQTRWPWYAHVAPMSWLVAHDVNDGRRHLNFSTWDAYASDPGTEAEKLEKLGRVIGNGSMPPWYYAMMHRGARLSRGDRSLVAGWASRSASALENVNTADPQ